MHDQGRVLKLDARNAQDNNVIESICSEPSPIHVRVFLKSLLNGHLSINNHLCNLNDSNNCQVYKRKSWDCYQLEVVKHTKLLSIIVSDDLRWSHQVEFMCQKVYKKVQLLRRMKILQLDQDIMQDFYSKEVRSILQLGVPCSVMTSGPSNNC